MFVNSDFTDLLKLFNNNQVRYLVIGWLRLHSVGAPLAGMTEADFAEEGYFYQMGVPPVRVDILMGVPGGIFEQAWSERVEVDFDSLLVPFISRQDLIAAKLAEGGSQDLLDAKALRLAGDLDAS